MLRDKFRAFTPARVPVDVAKWLPGEAVFVREISAAERLALADGLNCDRQADAAAATARLVLAAVVDAGGVQAFAPGDEAAVLALPAGLVDTLAEAAARANGITRDGAEADRGNSPAPAGGGSPTGSPSPSANGTSTACSPP